MNRERLETLPALPTGFLSKEAPQKGAQFQLDTQHTLGHKQLLGILNIKNKQPLARCHFFPYY